jgi:hypothetical protein
LECLRQSSKIAADIVCDMPQEWKVPAETVQAKLAHLLDQQWTAAVWENFMECLKENIR